MRVVKGIPIVEYCVDKITERPVFVETLIATS